MPDEPPSDTIAPAEGDQPEASTPASGLGAQVPADGPDADVEIASEAGSSVPPRVAAPMVAPTVQGDWLASVCPYLASEDGTYRSAAPDEGHRCVAVDPPATLPLAFQERFCLTDRHPRCEMYKYAQEVGEDGGIPVEAGQLHAAATRPVRQGTAGEVGLANRRPAIIAAGALGGVAVLVLLLVLLLGSCSGDPAGTADDGSPEPQATGAPPATSTPRPAPTVEPEPSLTPEPGATPASTAEGVGPGLTVLYQIQEGEALKKVAETFGITRKRILRANPQLEEMAPADMPGEIIAIPVPPEFSPEELEALPGYQGPMP